MTREEQIAEALGKEWEYREHWGLFCSGSLVSCHYLRDRIRQRVRELWSDLDDRFRMIKIMDRLGGERSDEAWYGLFLEGKSKSPLSQYCEVESFVFYQRATGNPEAAAWEEALLWLTEKVEQGGRTADKSEG